MSMMLIIASILCLSLVESANILIAIPYSVNSHYIMQRPIGLELARKGHNVTVITAFKEEHHPRNYHEVMVDNKKIWDVLGEKKPNLFTMLEYTDVQFYNHVLWNGGLAITETALNSSEVQHFLAQNNSFDLVISEQFYQESIFMLAHKYNAPLVLISTFGNCMRHNIAIRNPLQLSTVVFEFISISDITSFFGRLYNFYFSWYDYFWWRVWNLPKHEELVKKYIPNLPKPIPSLYEMQQNTSLLLINAHFSFDPPTAYLPNIIEIGGLHLTNDTLDLPQDLKKTLDEAKHGVVYVNFGSNVKSSELPKDKINAFNNVFRRLEQTILWKWEENYFDNKPSNVVLRKWMPQNAVLAHPNVKVFISHGGLIGTQEAIFSGVPIIGIPIYGDQYNNVLQAEKAGAGRILLFQDINEENLENKLKDVLTDKSYKQRAVELSQRFKDRPMKALDTAVYWIELVIRYKGAHYIKNPATELSWFAYYMIDVYVFTFIVTVFFIVILKINVGFLIKASKYFYKMKSD